ncbi:MAG: phospholipid carrier-dependent glycosyltransferase [Clostridia bacterium]|nr:phospholipid carrier-dependent glycosyltransferase [Clostridia bacterium]
MKFKWKILILTAVAIALMGTCAVAEENLIRNSGFDSVNQSGYPDAWSREMWYRDPGITEMAVVESDSGNCLYIENLDANDARYKQSVEVEPNTLYRISCRIRAEGCDTSRVGANISIDNTFIYSEQYYDTDGEWVEAVLYGMTAADQYDLTVMARIGGYGSLNIGRAWFDDFSMTRVDAAPAQQYVNSFATLPPVEAEEDEEDYEEQPNANLQAIWFILTGLVYAAICGVSLYARRPDDTKIENRDAKNGRVVYTALALAFVVRAIIAVCVRGYGVDMSCFEGWANQMAALGPSGFYTTDMFCDYPPGYMYALWLVGKAADALSINANSPAMWLAIKLIPMIMDIALAVIIYRLAILCMDGGAACVIAILFAFNPATIIDSAAWGQMDSVLIAFLVISMLLASRGKWLLSLPVYAMAVLIKPQALMFAPLGLIMLIVDIALSEHKWRMLLRIISGMALAFTLFTALVYPFTRSMPEAMLPESLSAQAFGYTITLRLEGFMRQAGWLINQYAKTLSSYNYLSVNACNLYTLIDMNWVGLDYAASLAVFSWVLMALGIIYSMFLYIKGKDRGKIFVSAAIMMALLFAFAPKMHERYLMPALAFLILAYIYDRDVRLLAAFIVMSFTVTVNTSLVLQNEHLIDPQRLVNSAVSLLNVLNAVFLAWVGWEMCVTGKIVSLTKKYKKAKVSVLLVERAKNSAQEGLARPRDARLSMKRRDWIIMIAMTLVYSVAAFTNLGDTQSPQTQWISTAPGEELTFDLGQSRQFSFMYHGGICDSTFMVQFSDDNVTWTPSHYANYDAGQMYRWIEYRPHERDEDGDLYELADTNSGVYIARYIRLTCERAGLTLNEVAFLDENGEPLPVESVYNYGGSVTHLYDPKALVDEQYTVPSEPSYLNGMYFDEIYHARTAYEHLHGMDPLEYTHPPLGKVLIMIGIELFGMTPFGWRFMGALFGVLMIPVMYLMAKQLFRRTSFAAIAAFLLMCDGMHFTQTRIATIDVFVVFFIMLMFLFMFRYAMMSFYHARLYKTLIPLGLCGISMGLAIACKWIGIYGGIGLAVIFFYTMFRRTREYLFAKKYMQSLDMDTRRVAQRVVKTYWKNLISTLLFCVGFFIIIPAVIYYLSYYWHMLPQGGLSISGVWNLQQSMFAYHQSIAADAHTFASPWYEWPLMLRPIWYYSGYGDVPDNMVSSISCLGNIVVWWGGLLAIIIMIARYTPNFARILFRGLHSARITKARSDRRYLYIIIGYLAQYVPWMLVSRCTFIYHYFACVPFIILATVAVFECMRKANVRAYRIVVCVYCVAALAFFAGFYPIMSGLPVNREYANHLKWFSWYLFR